MARQATTAAGDSAQAPGAILDPPKGSRTTRRGAAGTALSHKNRDPLSPSLGPIQPLGPIHTPVDIDGAPLCAGDFVRVAERGPSAEVREVLQVGYGDHLHGYIVVRGILGFAHGRRFRKVL